MSRNRVEEATQTVLQVAAIGLMALIWGLILHKGYTDLSRIADQHSGSDFWHAVARYVIRNLAGGN